jgi:hypothetical protein
MTVTELRSIAGDFARSGYFADAREAVQAVVKIQAGIELGFGPVYSMTKIYIVKGKVMVSAEALGALVKRSNRYDYSVKKLDDAECILVFTDTGKEVYTSKFTMEDAKRADLVKGDSGWQKWPRAMLMSKALSQGARIVCPHVISGVYTPADFGVETNSNGEIEQQPKVEVMDAKPPPNPEPLESIAGQSVIPPEDMITPAQRKKVFVDGGRMGYLETDLKDILVKHFKKEHTDDLTKKEASEFIDLIAQGKHINEQGELI